MVNTTDLTGKRCFHHGTREPVARCPECRRYYCRECVNDFEGRLLCVECLTRLSSAESKDERNLYHRLLPPLLLGMGLLMAWLVFYLLGSTLLSLPSSVHDARIWHAQDVR
jgi:hypothetical protein